MDNIGLQSEEEEGSGNILEKLLKPVIASNPENIAVKNEGCREDEEYFEEGGVEKLPVLKRACLFKQAFWENHPFFALFLFCLFFVILSTFNFNSPL